MTDDELKTSKSQKKRDMQALREMATQLTELSTDILSSIEDPRVRESIDAAKKITKGNARKRQLQYVAKLLSKTDIEPIQALLDTLDASSVTYVQKFHQLEQWREQLLSGEGDPLSEIFNNHPDTDRQQLRAMVKNARVEREKGEHQVHYKRLFQFLKAAQQADQSLD